MLYLCLPHRLGVALKASLFPIIWNLILEYLKLFKTPISLGYPQTMRFFITISSLVSAVLAASRTSPPSGSITVGSGGTYSTVGAS